MTGGHSGLVRMQAAVQHFLRGSLCKFSLLLHWVGPGMLCVFYLVCADAKMLLCTHCYTRHDLKRKIQKCQLDTFRK